MKKDELLDFEHKKKEIEKRKKEEEKARKKAEKSKKFRESIKSDYDEHKRYQAMQKLIFSEEDVNIKELNWGETSLQKVEKKFNLQKNIIIALLIVIGFSILFVWSANQSWAEERQVYEQTITNQKKENFDNKLLKFQYESREKLILFLKSNNIKYKSLEERNGMHTISFISNGKQYKINIIDQLQRIEFNIYKV